MNSEAVFIKQGESEWKPKKGEIRKVSRVRFHEAIFLPMNGGSRDKLDSAFDKDLSMWHVPGEGLLVRLGASQFTVDTANTIEMIHPNLC